jgi:hypothetical protein
MKEIKPDKAIYLDEDAAREYLEQLRWPNDTVCPHCGVSGAYKLFGSVGLAESNSQLG